MENEKIEQQIYKLIGDFDENVDKALIEKINKKINEKLEHETIVEDIISLIDKFDTKQGKKELKQIHERIVAKMVWKNPIPENFFRVVAIAAFLTFLYFTITSYIFEDTVFAKGNLKIRLFDYILYSFWAIAPPAYFLMEYLKVFPHKLDSSQLADLKYTQELSSKIWAALLIIFGVILYSRYGVK